MQPATTCWHDMREIIEILAWPATVVVVVAILRKPLADLVRTATKVKYRDLEVEFQKGIDSLRQTVPDALPGAAEPATHTAQVDLLELAQVSPSAAVIEAWKSIEASAKGLIARRGHKADYGVPTPYKMIQDILVRGKIIDEKWGKVFRELRQLRNKVSHAAGYHVTSEQAAEYVRLALRIRDHIDGVGTGDSATAEAS